MTKIDYFINRMQRKGMVAVDLYLSRVRRRVESYTFFS